jgi:hypothetical protein
MKWWITLAALIAIGLAVWLARPASRPEMPKLGEAAIEEPPRPPGQSARDVEPPPPPSDMAMGIESRLAASPLPRVQVTPEQLHLRNLVPPAKSPSERFIKKRRSPSPAPYFKTR